MDAKVSIRLQWYHGMPLFFDNVAENMLERTQRVTSATALFAKLHENAWPQNKNNKKNVIEGVNPAGLLAESRQEAHATWKDKV